MRPVWRVDWAASAVLQGRYNLAVAEKGVADAEVEFPSGNGECQTCGKKGILGRIRSRSLGAQVEVCDECLDDYRRGDPEVAKLVMGRLRPF